ncbi:MAG: tRNA pseudouridine32 synthase/23S rRNA pseudouridine746 synthase [Alteromonadaceae bacterium]|jgi:tRNA pseudouridine32 synthase/23S rRNA pseudouridine746 synthase
MYSQKNCFTSFKRSLDKVTLPERFTYPFYYQPHPIALLAVSELQQYLTEQQTAEQDNGQDNLSHSRDNCNATSAVHHSVSGKMFGVLVVQNENGELGYLCGFSGKLVDKRQVSKFVPPVFDTFAEDGFFKKEQVIINQLNIQIDMLESHPDVAQLTSSLYKQKNTADEQVEAFRVKIIASRKIRKLRRSAGDESFNSEQLNKLNDDLSKESVAEKNELRDLKLYWQVQHQTLQQPLTLLTDEIAQLKQRRKDLSSALQKKIFSQYRFLNNQGHEKSLGELFAGTAYNAVHGKPPAGAGECAAPKLLQHAFKWHLKPIAMAEFWWGQAPKSAVRQHKNFYGACIGKCQPILTHMLAGMAVDENPLLKNPAEGKSLEIIYQDEDMLIINKPAEFLSVPGKNISDCVYNRIKQLFPQASGAIIVHRLDMSTSGLMVIALNKPAHKNLQKQFINREVQKRYVALIAGLLPADSGIITLPLAGDYDDRPRQLVCFESGKPAETTWQVIERNEDKLTTRLYLSPKTGRTHQLRVHCAHTLGLNMPIIGDDLYGNKANRLHLHAQMLALTHPTTQELMHFEVEAEF